MHYNHLFQHVPLCLLWVECFSLMASVLTTRYPERASDLFTYQNTIVHASRSFAGDHWVTYDLCYQRQAAARKSLQWSLIDFPCIMKHSQEEQSQSPMQILLERAPSFLRLHVRPRTLSVHQTYHYIQCKILPHSDMPAVQFKERQPMSFFAYANTCTSVWAAKSCIQHLPANIAGPHL